MLGKIIGISGLIGSGKGAVSDILVEQHGFKKLSFAAKLKDGAAAMFNWPRDLLEGNTTQSREWRDTPDIFWTLELGYCVTPRLVLQLLGTECMRKGFHNDFWILLVKKELHENPMENFVIPDVRFYNERDLIKSLNGEVWQVTRNNAPLWMQNAISDNHNGTSLMDKFDIHESEYRWMDYDSAFTHTIINNGTLEELILQIKRIMQC